MLRLTLTSDSLLRATGSHTAAAVGTEAASLTCLRDESTVSLLVCFGGELQHAGVLFEGLYRVDTGGRVRCFQRALMQRFEEHVSLAFADDERVLTRAMSRVVSHGHGGGSTTTAKLMTHTSSACMRMLVDGIHAELACSYAHAAAREGETNCLRSALSMMQVLVPHVNWSMQTYDPDAAYSQDYDDSDGDENENEYHEEEWSNDEEEDTSSQSESQCVVLRALQAQW